MFFGRFAHSLDRVLRRHPDLRTPIGQVLGAIRKVPPGGLIDPLLVSRVTHIDREETLAYLNILSEAGLGSFVIRVLDPEGSELGRYDSLTDIPPQVPNEFGDLFVVHPESIEISFEPDVARVQREARALVGFE